MTFRLHDAIPLGVVEGWRREREDLLATAAAMGRRLSPLERDRLNEISFERIEEYLHRGAGSCLMRDAAVAGIVAAALRHFDRERYDLLAWCVMPNHVHAVFRAAEGHELSAIMHSWKSFTAHAINRRLARTGPVWQQESYDHLVRDEVDLGNQVRYVAANPARARLGAWPWVGGRMVEGTGL